MNEITNFVDNHNNVHVIALYKAFDLVLHDTD